MITWKHKVKVPDVGICTVRELTDKEATQYKPPRSAGFVNLYHGDEHVGWCGVNFAEEHIMNWKARNKALVTKNKNSFELEIGAVACRYKRLLPKEVYNQTLNLAAKLYSL